MSDYDARCKKALDLSRSGIPTSLIAERFGIKRPSVNRMISDAIAAERASTLVPQQQTSGSNISNNCPQNTTQEKT